jgi:hypothetical protein
MTTKLNGENDGPASGQVQKKKPYYRYKRSIIDGILVMRCKNCSNCWVPAGVSHRQRHRQKQTDTAIVGNKILLYSHNDRDGSLSQGDFDRLCHNKSLSSVICGIKFLMTPNPFGGTSSRKEGQGGNIFQQPAVHTTK